jgi:hypothetical protein
MGTRSDYPEALAAKAVPIICNGNITQSGFSAEHDVADIALRSRRAANEDSAVGDRADLALGHDGEEVASPIPIVEVKCPLGAVSGPSADREKAWPDASKPETRYEPSTP